MKNTDDFCYKGKPSCAATKLTPFAASKDELDTREDNSKSMKNALYILHAKRHVSGWSNVKQWKKINSIALASQLLSQSVSRKFHLIYTYVYILLNFIATGNQWKSHSEDLVLPIQYRTPGKFCSMYISRLCTSSEISCFKFHGCLFTQDFRVLISMDQFEHFCSLLHSYERFRSIFTSNIIQINKACKNQVAQYSQSLCKA